MSRDPSLIVGVGYTEISPHSGRSTLDLATEAATAALADAGIDRRSVDGVVTFHLNDSASAVAIASALGLDAPSLLFDWTNGGGNVACGTVGVADAAVRAGMADVVIIYRCLNGRSGLRFGGKGQRLPVGGSRELMTPVGWLTFAEMVAVWCRRHMEVYGTTTEDLAAVAIKSRANAFYNARAQKREPLDRETYFASPMICDPFRLFDMCLESDGACALVVTSPDRANDCAARPVEILSAASGATSSPGIDLSDTFASPDLTRNFGYAIRDRLYGRAALTPADLDLAEIYDCFTASVLLALESFGIVEPGEAGSYVREAETLVAGGVLPVNTHGGLLSEGYLHGLNHVTEAVLQLRGECGPRQVEGAEVALVTSGVMSQGSALLLGRT